MDQGNQIEKAYLAAVVFSVVVGFSFLGVKTCITVASTLQILVWRYNWAALLMGILIILKIAKLDLRAKAKKNLILTAGFYIGFMILQTIGLIFSTSVESGIIFAIIPILARIIGGVVLDEKSTWQQNIFVMISISSLILMIILGASELETSIVGIIILLLSSLSMAISNVYMRYVRAFYRPVEITTYICFMGVVAFNLAFLASGEFTTYFEPLVHIEFIIATIYLGTACIVLSAQLMAFMLRYLPPIKATIFGNLSTAISIVAGVVFLQETLKYYHIICTILIVIGVIGVSMPQSKKTKNKLNGCDKSKIEEIERK